MVDFSQLPRFKNHQFSIVTMIPEWAMAYQTSIEAIERQIPIGHAWCNANPKKAPRKDILRFLHNWMRLAKKHGNLVDKSVNRAYKEDLPTDNDILDEKTMQQGLAELKIKLLQAKLKARGIGS